MRTRQRGLFLWKRARGSDGRAYIAADDLISIHGYYKDSTPGIEVQGDGAANGTSICTLSISAGKRFICTHLMASTNVGAMIRVGTGTLAAMTNIYPIDLQNTGSYVAITELMPIFDYDNSAGAAAVTLIMYAPQTAKGVATNNDVNHFFDGFIGGLEY